MRAQLYGVFIGTKWALTRNKKKALTLAKENHGTVRAMPLPSGHYSWDAPTFRVSSDEIANYQQVQKAPRRIRTRTFRTRRVK